MSENFENFPLLSMGSRNWTINNDKDLLDSYAAMRIYLARSLPETSLFAMDEVISEKIPYHRPQKELLDLPIEILTMILRKTIFGLPLWADELHEVCTTFCQLDSY